MSDESDKPERDELPKQPEQAQKPTPKQTNSDSYQTQQQSQSQQNQFQQQQQQFFAVPGMPTVGRGTSGKDFFAAYQPALNVYDEFVDSELNLRNHCRRLAIELSQIGEQGMAHRDKQIRRMIHQNGIAYSAYGDPSAREKHLQLDLIPQLFADAEWLQIEKALSQRADLLNLILADLYGERTLLTRGLLPPEVLLHHPHYQLPYHELPQPGGFYLHCYAAEIVRSPSGDWWIKSDRTDSPSGMGFALENRIAISRAIPNAFRRCNVYRLASYFIALRDHLASLAKTNQDDPRIAILSAGAGSERYFEDSFLARYLGFTLVETNDLVVRSGKVMLKTLAGLSQVDVIFRRNHDHSLDPLELGGGIPGIPGILQVIRDGQVVVANAPGSGLVESPIFMAFMPRICQAILGCDLELPGVATWWGGEPDSLERILDRVDELQLKPAFRVRSGGGRGFGHRQINVLKPETMTRDERISLLRKNPKAWVGQEKVARSSAAVWDGGKLTHGYVSFRAFLTASQGAWRSLPGALVQVSSSPHESTRSLFAHGRTKDAWVLADRPVPQTSLLKKTGDLIEPVRTRGFLPSRVADNLCWLGRYLERADASARLIRAVALRLTGEANPEDSVELPVLIRAMAITGQVDVGYSIQDFASLLPSLESSLALHALNHDDIDSLRYQVDRIVSLAGTVRDRLSSDAWRIVQEMSSSFSSSDPRNCDLVDLLDIIDTLVVGLAAFSGFVSECMTRTHGFHFLNIGRRLEHALQTTGLIKNCFCLESEVSGELLESVLQISESELTYRSRYYANLQLAAVLDLLIVDKLNPRSLAYQLVQLQENLGKLPGNTGQESSSERLSLQETLNAISGSNFVELGKPNQEGKRDQLIELLDNVETDLADISRNISNRFFVHSGPIHQLIADAEPDGQDEIAIESLFMD